ncbi:MAG: alpha/beta hydrolase [Planctomycetia bacterium]|nr:alpha/beta hydrolase [Planctomycetia bacterium]
MSNLSKFFVPLVLAGVLFSFNIILADSSEYQTEENIFYYNDECYQTADDYQRQQCRLDLYYPKNESAFSTVVWFHGGGLTGGKRYFPDLLKDRGIAVVAVEYRLSPQVEFPKFLEDAAAAVAWTFQNIERFGGDRSKIFVCGGSAGAYLTAMVGMDPRWLNPYHIKQQELAGLILVSGQVTTHFHIKKLLKIPGEQYQPVIDENAPLAYLSSDLPPILLVLGDRKMEWKARVEENELMFASLKALGHSCIDFIETPGMGHEISALGNNIPIETQQKIIDFLRLNPIEKP